MVEGRSGNCPAILVSQPGGSYIYLVCPEKLSKEIVKKQKQQLKVQVRVKN